MSKILKLSERKNNMFRDKATIYFTQNKCNPLVRNIIKAVFLLDNIYVEFERGQSDELEVHNQRVDISLLINELAKVYHWSEALDNQTIQEELLKLVERSDEIHAVITAIMTYLYSPDKVCNEEKQYILQWNKFYEKELQFLLKGSSSINRTNFEETPTYLELFEKQRQGMKEMENATATLLDTIPCDVDTIADIGSGPGLVNQYIPYYYEVLAVDINEEILAQNTRKTLIGDILDIPLADCSVDMSIACDVVEHLETDKITHAIEELKRISRKYIYIQVPHNEILRYSVAKCQSCGNIWHVNFHKNSFVLEDIQKFEDDDWIVSRVNYTGDVYNEWAVPELYSEIEEEELDIYRVNGFKCPKCGEYCQEENVEELLKLEKKYYSTQKRREVKPKYTEMGVLFEKRNFTQNGVAKEILPKYYNNIIDFRYPFLKKTVYSGKEQLPMVIHLDNALSNGERGVLVKKNAEYSWLGIVFPFSMKKMSIIKISGECKSRTVLNIVGLNQNNKEYLIKKQKISGKQFSITCFCLNKRAEDTFIKIYYDNDFVLFSATMKLVPAETYFYVTQEDVKNKHYSIWNEQIQYSYFIPKDGVGFANMQKLFPVN